MNLQKGDNDSAQGGGPEIDLIDIEDHAKTNAGKPCPQVAIRAVACVCGS